MSSSAVEFQKKRSFERRIIVLYSFLGLCGLVIVSRLIELQIVKGQEYYDTAQSQHYGGIVLPAKRGEILSRSAKSDETSILATNTTLDLLYVDPLVVTTGHADVADTLANILVTDEFDALCRHGHELCPKELLEYYASAFDPLATSPLVQTRTMSGASVPLFEPVDTVTKESLQKRIADDLPDVTEIRRQFARSIEDRIRTTNVTFVPLLYSANKEQIAQVDALRIGGVFINAEQKLIYANPEQIDQSDVSSIARSLSPILVLERDYIAARLRQRPLRYVPIMSGIPPELSTKIKQVKLDSSEETDAKRTQRYEMTGEWDNDIVDPFRGVALIPEHRRYYPDTTIGSHVVGFLNALQEPQYGIERTFDAILRGQEGLISTVSDPFGGQIVSAQQKLVDARDGSTIVLTIDRTVQSAVEKILDEKVKEVDAQSGQAIVMDPFTGKIIAMANAPLFNSNEFTSVFKKEPIILQPGEEEKIIVEVFHPVTNARVLFAYYPDLTMEGRKKLSKETQQEMAEIEKLYDVSELTRYYKLIGQHHRIEIFPTDQRGVWLKYSNNIGVGSYLNRSIQEIYEPGSVMKAITMAVAIDQGEVVPSDVYDDTGTVEVDEFTIRNALNAHYGRVSMTDCIAFSINTCMTDVSKKLGKKLFYTMLTRFQFGNVTGIELDNELPGEVRPWREWSDALLATSSYGQGVSTTPLQMIRAFAALANGGKLIKPTIIDEIRNSDGTVQKSQPVVLDHVIKEETAETMKAILVSSVRKGWAKAAAVPGYKTAGKTGTSQIAGPGGRYESGTGSTIATYAGFAPVDTPKFVVLVKIDRPNRDEYGSRSAAPIFRDIAKFLFEYYGIPPDDR